MHIIQSIVTCEGKDLFFSIGCSCCQVKGQKPPAPVRGLKGMAEAGDAEEAEEGEEAAPVADLIPRNDIRYFMSFCYEVCVI